ncbi:type II toxin-antitoxin system RelE/ParE family toxin [Patescibacteria group bacterium]|nr:type II toxin-antitoxin system RelE/ParE family toxin [Patescibacteria group bacterium]
MKQFNIFFTKQAKKDVKLLDERSKAKLQKILLQTLSENPYLGKKLLGELRGNYSFRLSIKDRVIYSIDSKKRIIYIKRARTHYGD